MARGRKPNTSNQKSRKMDVDELVDMVKSSVKEALEEEKNAEEDAFEKRRKSDEGDLIELIEEAMEVVGEKRKSRKEDGEELEEITVEEVFDAVIEVLEEEAKGDYGDDEDKSDDEYDDEKSDDEEKEDEEKGDEEEKEDDEKRRRKSSGRGRQTKSRSNKPTSRPANRKYSSLYYGAMGNSRSASKKKVPADIQLARAVKCLDVFGRHDPERAAHAANKRYGDPDMAREFKALSATSPSGGGFLIPEVYLDEIIEMLYAKTVIFELGARKLPMEQGNLNIPKMTTGTRATWGGEARKIAKTQPGYGNLKLSAKRLEAIVAQTRELMMSTSFSADQMFANDLTRRMELGLDWGGMFGKGGEFQPLGVFQNKEVEKIDAKKLNNTALASASGIITPDFPVFLRSKVLAKNVDDQFLGWVMNSVLEGMFMNMKTTTGAYIYRDEMNNGRFLGFPYGISNQIGTDENGYTSLGFGNWSDLLVGEQLGLETYTTLDGSWVDEDGVQHNAFEENLAGTRALMYVDIGVRHAESFISVNNIKAF